MRPWSSAIWKGLIWVEYNLDVKLAINRLLEGLFCFLSSCETNQKMLSPPEILGEKMPVGGDFFGSHFVFLCY